MEDLLNLPRRARMTSSSSTILTSRRRETERGETQRGRRVRNSETTAPSACLAGQGLAVSHTDHAAAGSAAVRGIRLTLIPASPPSVTLPALLTFVKIVSKLLQIDLCPLSPLKIFYLFCLLICQGYRCNVVDSVSERPTPRELKRTAGDLQSHRISSKLGCGTFSP